MDKIIAFENQGLRNLMTYQVSEKDTIDEVSASMLNNNNIEGMLPFSRYQLDATLTFKYDITSKMSLRKFFMTPVNKEKLIGVLESIIDCIILSEGYFLNLNQFLLNMDYVFVDIRKNKAYLAYVPLQNMEFSLLAFINDVMRSIQFENPTNAGYAMSIFNYINRVNEINVYEFKQLLDEISQKTMGQPMVNQQPVMNPAQQPIQQPVNQPIANQIRQSMEEIPKKPTPAVPTVSQKPKNKKQNNKIAQSPNISNTPSMPSTAGTPNVGFDIPGQQSGLKVQQEKDATPPKKEKEYVGLTAVVMNAFGNKDKKTKEPKEQKQKQKSNKKNKQGKKSLVAPPPSNMNIPGRQPQPSIPVQPAVPVQPVSVQPQASPVIEPLMPMNGIDVNETTILTPDDDMGTTVLTPQMKPGCEVMPYFTRVSTNQRIDINKNAYRFGTKSNMVDYVCMGNRTVSGVHAEITLEGGSYFIMDLGSTNGTYINDNKIAPNTKIELQNGYEVKLANEVFKFSTNG